MVQHVFLGFLVVIPYLNLSHIHENIHENNKQTRNVWPCEILMTAAALVTTEWTNQDGL